MQTSRSLALTTVLTLLGACATSAPRSPPPSAADEALAHRVYLALNADPWYFFRHVDVRIDGGVADLSGYVWSADALYQARQIASGVPGVTRVVTSHLELERNGLSNGVTR
jgi:osmotically-inducible protein OsmY